MKKALILNEYLSDNLGDQAIGISMAEFLQNKEFETTSVYLSQPDKNELSHNRAEFEIKTTRISSLKSILYILVFYYRYKSIILKRLIDISPDIVIIGGGQLVNSSKQNMLSGFAISLFWWTRIIKKYSANIEICTIGIGVATGFSSIEKKLYQSALNRVDRFYVRDQRSKNNLKNNFGKSAQVAPDIAFYSSKTKSKYNSKSLILLGIANYEEVFLRYNNFKAREEYWEDVIENSTFRNRLKGIKLFYTTRKDLEEVKLFKGYILDKYNISLEILYSDSLKELETIIEKCEVLSSGRMHALIIGMKHNAQVIPYPISNKLRAFDSEYANKYNGMELSKLINESIKI